MYGIRRAYWALESHRNPFFRKGTIMSTTPWTNPVGPRHRRPEAWNLGDLDWQALLDEDRFAFSTVSFLLTAIIGLGLLGLVVVVCILAFGG